MGQDVTLTAADGHTLSAYTEARGRQKGRRRDQEIFGSTSIKAVADEFARTLPGDRTRGLRPRQPG